MEPLHVTVTGPEGQSRTFLFDKPTISIGKAPANALVLPSSFISRYHGELRYEADGWRYRDVGSTNGTVVKVADKTIKLNGRRCDNSVPLRGNELIRLGDYTIAVKTRTPKPTRDRRIDSILHTAHHERALTILRDSSRSQSAVLRALFEAAGKLASLSEESEIEEYLPTAARALCPSLTHLYLFESKDSTQGAEGWTPKWWWAAQSDPIEAPQSFSRGLIDRVVSIGESILVSSTDTLSASTGKGGESQSSICVPLRGRHGILGILTVDRRVPDHPFVETDLHLMTLFGDLVAATLERLRETQRLMKTFGGFVDAAIRAIESRDPPTAGHSARVAQYCMAMVIAVNRCSDERFKEVQISDSERLALYYAALLHDFGKIGVREEVFSKARKLPENILREVYFRFERATYELKLRCATSKLLPGTNADAADAELEAGLNQLASARGLLERTMGNAPIAKELEPELHALTEPLAGIALLELHEVQAMLGCRGTLTPSEREHMESHASLTRWYLERIPWEPSLARIPEIASSHHEMLNGKGYPKGLKAEDLPLDVRILSVCDIYDALTSADRAYRRALTREEAMKVLRAEVARGALDADLVELMETALEEKVEDMTAWPFRMAG